jgi:hypothetical protein
MSQSSASSTEASEACASLRVGSRRPAIQLSARHHQSERDASPGKDEEPTRPSKSSGDGLCLSLIQLPQIGQQFERRLVPQRLVPLETFSNDPLELRAAGISDRIDARDRSDDRGERVRRG